ncbi:Hsp20/alpha crystallin family protein [Actinomadura sp. ATCC 31491]|uniref:Hsp20/alpha crystallin family protein n=1 Tax=Actinomadura luzonensis TaxID=2805427 RepID=A0ABT0FN65_9ACTN|nr:Hsp20/alpha crystallin family protein [Actinomadura luzonensis]MCK2213789.1 Hsp20/alpha crystallin family protein [Actinomadura luzonensis]
MALPTKRHRAPMQWGNTTLPSRSWDPFTEFQQLWDQMGRLFEQGEADAAVWRPVAETEEAAEAYLVRAELPGLRRDEVNVEIDGNELCISGEISEDDKGNRLKRRTGKFAYRTILPADADTDRVGCELSDGVLTVRVPKTEQGRSRRISIRG